MTNSEIIEKAVKIAIDIALDDKHGYSQINRNGPDFDCSSLVLYCYNCAGANTGGATFTGNMRQLMCAAGWDALPPTTTLCAGDILLNEKYHTALYIGNNQIVEGYGDEKGGIGRGAQTGDQTGNEIRITSYYKFSKGWDCILRLPTEGSTVIIEEFCSVRIPVVKYGDVSPAVCALQSALNYHGYGWLELDGVFGNKTLNAVKKFQRINNIKVDGIVSADTWYKVLTWR